MCTHAKRHGTRTLMPREKLRCTYQHTCKCKTHMDVHPCQVNRYNTHLHTCQGMTHVHPCQEHSYNTHSYMHVRAWHMCTHAKSTASKHTPTHMSGHDTRAPMPRAQLQNTHLHALLCSDCCGKLAHSRYFLKGGNILLILLRAGVSPKSRFYWYPLPVSHCREESKFLQAYLLMEITPWLWPDTSISNHLQKTSSLKTIPLKNEKKTRTKQTCRFQLSVCT